MAYSNWKGFTLPGALSVQRTPPYSRTLKRGPAVSVIQRFHCVYLNYMYNYASKSKVVFIVNIVFLEQKLSTIFNTIISYSVVSVV